MHIGAMDSRQSLQRRRPSALNLGVLVLAICLCMVVPAVARAQTSWPAETGSSWPTDIEYTVNYENSASQTMGGDNNNADIWNAWSPGSIENGSYLPWDEPNQAVFDFDRSVGVASYGGQTYVFVAQQGNGTSSSSSAWNSVVAYGYDFPTSTSNGSPSRVGGSGSSSSFTVTQGGTPQYFLGVCQTGGSVPDIYAFYTLQGASNTQICYTEASEDFNIQHTAQAWSSSWYHFEDNVMQGSIVAVQGGFAFVFIDSTEQCVRIFGTDLLATTPPTTWPTTTVDQLSGSQQVRSVSAIALSESSGSGSSSSDPATLPETLAIGWLNGTPGSSTSGTLSSGEFGNWSNVSGSLTLANITTPAEGPVQFDLAQEYSLPAGANSPDQMPLQADYGWRDIRLVQGGVGGGATGDVVTALIRAGGASQCGWGSGPGLDLTGNNNTVSNSPVLEFERFYAMQATLDMDNAAGSQITGVQELDAANNRGCYYYRRNETNYMQIPTDCVGTSFWAFPTYAVNGTTQQQYIQYLSTATCVFDNANSGHGPSQPYTGTLGGWGVLTSDVLKPATPAVTVDPVSLTSPEEMQLIGVVFGPPPFSPQGEAPGSNHFLSSEISFQDEEGNSAGSQTQQSSSSSKGPQGLAVSASLAKGVAEGALGFGGLGFGSTLGANTTYTLETTQGSQQTWSSDIGFSWDITAANQTGNGYLIYQAPALELNCYQRYDWSGDNEISTSQVWLTTPVSSGPNVQQTAFNMVDPTKSVAGSSTVLSTGITPHGASDDPTSWLDAPQWDPLAAAGTLPAGSTYYTAKMTASTASGGQTTAVFDSSSATMNAQQSTNAFKLTVPGYSYSTTSASGSKTTTNNGENITFTSPQLYDPGKAGTGVDSQVSVEAYWLPGTYADSAPQNSSSLYSGSYDATTKSYNDPGPYWVPEVFRGLQAPWCIDYMVTSVQSYSSSGSSASPTRSVGGAETTCAVATNVRPVGAGAATVRLGAGAPARMATVGSGGAVLTAKAADGYRFVKWEALGKGPQVRIADPTSKTTAVRIRNGGYDLVRAHFARILPKRVDVRRRGSSSCDLTVQKASLSRALASLSKLRQAAVTVVMGDQQISVPKTAWHGSHARVTAYVHPRAWRSHHGKIKLTVDFSHRSWSLTASHVQHADRLLRDCAGGRADLALLANGRQRQPFGVPVAARATFSPRSSRATFRTPSTVKAPVSLAGAQVRTTATTSASGSRFSLSGVKIDRSLLRSKGFQLTLCGQSLPVGPFHKSAGTWQYKGRTAGGMSINCVYDSKGRLSLKLAGAALAGIQNLLTGPNLSLAVAAAAPNAAVGPTTPKGGASLPMSVAGLSKVTSVATGSQQN